MRLPLGWVHVYELLWGCNTALLLAAVAMVTNQPALAGGAVRLWRGCGRPLLTTVAPCVCLDYDRCS